MRKKCLFVENRKKIIFAIMLSVTVVVKVSDKRLISFINHIVIKQPSSFKTGKISLRKRKQAFLPHPLLPTGKHNR